MVVRTEHLKLECNIRKIFGYGKEEGGCLETYIFYFSNFSYFIEILLAYLKNLRIFAAEFGARLLDSRGDE